MWNLRKIIQMNLLGGHDRSANAENGHVDVGGEGGGMNGEMRTDIYTPPCKTDRGSCSMYSTGSPALCSELT